MNRINEPLKFARETRRFVVYEGGATVMQLYITKPALPRQAPRYITVVVTDGDEAET